MSRADQLLQRVEGYAGEMVEAMARLTAVPALGPTNGGRGRWTRPVCSCPGWHDLDLTVERVDAPDDRVEGGVAPTCWPAWRAATPRRCGCWPTWTWCRWAIRPVVQRPLDLRVDGDRLCGRGIEDNHHGLLGGLLRAKGAHGLGVHPAGAGRAGPGQRRGDRLPHGLDHCSGAAPGLRPRDLIVVPDSAATTAA